MPGMIVAPQPLAVEEGAKVLASGGNAFDAALTAAMVHGGSDPQSCGIGGYMVRTAVKAGQSVQNPFSLWRCFIRGSVRASISDEHIRASGKFDQFGAHDRLPVTHQPVKGHVMIC